MTELERIRSFMRDSEEAVCDEARPARHGTSLLTPGLPLVWQLNVLRVEDPEADPDRLVEEAERLQGGLAHRKLLVPDPELGARLAPALARRGWNVGRLLVMVRRRAPDRPPRRGLGGEVDRRAGAHALAAFRREQPLDAGSETIRQLAEMDERYSRRVGARDFAAPQAEGHSSCRLFAGSGIGQVDQVGTLQGHRNRGYGRAAVLAAADAATADGLDPVFLITDAGDWPQYLYRRLGFEPLDRAWEFLKLPLGATPP
jgi:GNAT superfamily N-acetyltransferase